MPDYLQHGRRHVRGTDDIPCDWILLSLLNGWTNIGSPMPPSRFCFTPGMDPVTGDPHFLIELAATGGTPGSVIANLGFTLATDKPVKAADDGTGTYRPYTVKANGDIMDGAA